MVQPLRYIAFQDVDTDRPIGTLWIQRDPTPESIESAENRMKRMFTDHYCATKTTHVSSSFEDIFNQVIASITPVYGIIVEVLDEDNEEWTQEVRAEETWLY